MTEHDPICTRFRRAVDEPFQPCICGELREARADEQAKRINPYDDYTIHQISDAALAELRAKVLALADALPKDSNGAYALGRRHTYWEIITLIDGSSE
jgi:hypothetical protein